MTDWTDAHAAIFFPHAQEARARARSEGFRFAYYTTADTAMRILQGKSIWLRNASLMNDFSEVQHGFQCVRAAIGMPGGRLLAKNLEVAGPGLLDRAWEAFVQRADELFEQTYITCISEQRAEDPDIGRLSMWRAYGGNAGVAFLFNGTPMLQDSDVLGVYSSRVLYGGAQEIDAQFHCIAGLIARQKELLVGLAEETLLHTLFQMFWFDSICTKHRAFEEEREWRVLGSPTIFAVSLPSHLQTICGIPQRVYELEFKDRSSDGLEGLHLDALVDRVLVGPCDHPEVVADALVEQMTVAGIKDARARVQYTYIPLRQNQR